ncbi:MAG: polysaccharide export protein [Lachnospiraceae bacterium]|nr:polysaccharide export protein [Lachnospiraceae bacterium]
MERRRNDNVIEIDLVELFFVLLRHIWLIIASVVTGAAVAFVVTVTLITPMYSSSVMLYVLSRTTSITSLVDLQTGSQLTQDYKVFITSRPVVEKVISDLDLDMGYKEFVDNVTVENETNTRILNVTVKNHDPQMAKVIADDLADVSSVRMAEVMETDAPNIVDYGHVAEKPISPNRMINTVIGALAGFALMAGILTLRYVTDDSIKTSEDIEKYLGINTIGMIPLEDDGNEGLKKKKKRKRKKTA